MDHNLSLIFIKYMYDIVLEISFLDINSQNWNTGSCLKLWQVIVKIQHWCEGMSNIPLRDWRACKNWFFTLIFFYSGHFFDPSYLKKDQKRARTKNFLYPKISSVMPISSAKKFLKYVLYFQTFLHELQMPASIPILRIDV